MKKTILKLLATIVSIVGIIFLQEFIRDYFSIDKRIWFFVQYLGIIFIFCGIGLLFDNEIKNLKNWKQYLNHLKHTLNKITQSKFINICKKVISIIYKLIDLFIWIPATALVLFNIIYPDTYDNYIWIKITSFTFYILFTLNLFIIYKTSKKTLYFIGFIIWLLSSIFTLFDILICIV